jgi:hypothetical protein
MNYVTTPVLRHSKRKTGGEKRLVGNEKKKLSAGENNKSTNESYPKKGLLPDLLLELTEYFVLWGIEKICWMPDAHQPGKIFGKRG